MGDVPFVRHWRSCFSTLRGRGGRDSSLGASPRQLPRDACEPALELANARFPRVSLDDRGNDVRIEAHRLWRETILAELPRDEELPCDHELLLVQIPG